MAVRASTGDEGSLEARLSFSGASASRTSGSVAARQLELHARLRCLDATICKGGASIPAVNGSQERLGDELLFLGMSISARQPFGKDLASELQTEVPHTSQLLVLVFTVAWM